VSESEQKLDEVLREASTCDLVTFSLRLKSEVRVWQGSWRLYSQKPNHNNSYKVQKQSKNMKKFEDVSSLCNQSNLKKVRDINEREELAEVDEEMEKVNEEERRMVIGLKKSTYNILIGSSEETTDQKYSRPNLLKYFPIPRENLKPYGNSF
jgi:hypothetical protein